MGVLVVLAYLAVRWRRALRLLVALGLVGSLLFVSARLLSGGGTGSMAGLGRGARPLSGAPGGGGTGAGLPAVLVAALAAAVALALLAIGFVAVRGEPATRPEPTPTDSSSELTAVGEAAGRAATRIDGTDSLDNAVYRAWRDMTQLLDLRAPASSTPREFQRAAIDAGMEPDDVRALTALFRQVRYGDEAPSAEDERQAIDLLRSIEGRYGGENGA
ncbi:DUF4129 domain-containing protein [Halomicroarcula sp. GCM10025709]|uniref:DUF4129 domain-containing protein n=1 Tax=Haloarcula TaxID=2237 RepID=UPI0024C3A908|nr:DUF4129 domain-containing protein [Halomicroarcula sp. YJ-61-S]